jgi:hypothetical protein
MIDPSDVELAAMKKCLKAFGEAAGEIGFTKPLGDYSEAEALQVIDAIVTCYTEAMVAHHEASKYPPVRGMTPAPDPLANPFADLEDDLPWEEPKGGSHDRLQLLIEHLRSGHRPGRRRDAAGRARQSERQYLGASRLGVACERALQFEYAKAPIDHGRDTLAGCCASSSAAMSWRTAWSRGCGTRALTCAPARPTASSSVSRWHGRLQGHIDGVIVGGPEGFAYPALWENKCLGNKSWRELEKKASLSPSRSTPRKWRSTKPISNCTSTRRSSRHSTPTRWRSTPSRAL